MSDHDNDELLEGLRPGNSTSPSSTSPTSAASQFDHSELRIPSAEGSRYSQHLDTENCARGVRGASQKMKLSDISWLKIDKLIHVEDSARGEGKAAAAIAVLPTGENITIGVCSWDDGYIDVRALKVEKDEAQYRPLLTSGRIGIYETTASGPRPRYWFIELTQPTVASSGAFNGIKVSEDVLSRIAHQPLIEALAPFGTLGISTKGELTKTESARRGFLVAHFALHDHKPAIACYALCRVLPIANGAVVDRGTGQSIGVSTTVNNSGSNTRHPKRDTALTPSSEVSRTTKLSLKPTQEQIAVIDKAGSQKDLVVEALAGTGKTSTLKMFAIASKGLKGQYLAFNKSIVQEATSTFPENVNCSTAHGLAYRSIGHRYAERINGSRNTNKDVAEFLQSSGFAYQSRDTPLFLTADQVARYSTAAVQAFCRSHLDEITTDLVPLPIGLEEGTSQSEEFVSAISIHAQKLWEDFSSTSGRLSWNGSHDVYLKLWQLSRPVIPADFILFDEAQDADPVMLTVVNDQSQAQLVYCGDDYQTLYEWRGAKNALALASVDERLWLTQSFRFGEQIANVANNFLRKLKAPYPILGNPKVHSILGKNSTPQAVLCRTNSAVFSALIDAHETGRKAAVIGGARDLVALATACEVLQDGVRTSHPDLAPFQTWNEVMNWIEENPEQDPTIARDIRLIDKFTPKGIKRILNRIVDEKHADVTISTVHQSKGREWNSVRVGNDFTHPDDMEPEELRVAYVAVTRGKQQLDLAGMFDDERRKESKTVENRPASGSKTRPKIYFGTTRRRF